MTPPLAMLTTRTPREQGKALLNDLQRQNQEAIDAYRRSQRMRAIVKEVARVRELNKPTRVKDILDNNTLKEFMQNEGYIIQRRRDLPILIRDNPVKRVKYTATGLPITYFVKGRQEGVGDESNARASTPTLPKELPEHASTA